MPDIFINYRTGDGDVSAALIHHELSRRFGSERIFRAGESIPPGEDYTRALPTNVRKSEVLLAVIGPRWLDDQGRKYLRNRGDWVRREILEAFDHGVCVVPVLVGRTLERLRRSDLPPKLAWLADCNSLRLDPRNSRHDLRKLGDELVRIVPSLAAHDRSEEAAEPDADGRGSTTLHARDRAHQQTGGTSSVVHHPRGPVHTGTGNQINGDGWNYVEGDNSGEMRQNFDSRRKRPDDER